MINSVNIVVNNLPVIIVLDVPQRIVTRSGSFVVTGIQKPQIVQPPKFYYRSVLYTEKKSLDDRSY